MNFFFPSSTDPVHIGAIHVTTRSSYLIVVSKLPPSASFFRPLYCCPPYFCVIVILYYKTNVQDANGLLPGDDFAPSVSASERRAVRAILQPARDREAARELRSIVARYVASVIQGISSSNSKYCTSPWDSPERPPFEWASYSHLDERLPDEVPRPFAVEKG